MKADFLVIGSGIAGLSFAIKAAEHGSVTLITKNDFLNSNTAWAQGGISAVLPEALRDPGDTVEKHIADTIDAGAGLCDEETVRSIIEDGELTIDELVSWGSDFDQNGGRYSLGREGGHSNRRVLHSKDTTGHEIASSLLETARRTPGLTILADHMAIDLITTDKLGSVTDDRVVGAYVLEKATGEVSILRSNRVVLATGGCGKIYLYTTNPDSATGDGVAMAWRAGARIANMEFIQFHPTCFYNPAATGPEARSFLISEALRGEGAVLLNDKGEDFTLGYDKRGSLAPRDIVARAIDTEIKKTGANCVYLDITHKPAGFIAERFPFIYKTLLEFGHDAEKTPIPVVPAAHYQCGGVVAKPDGATNLRGLFVIGEAACTGLHGANRLASNSLLEGNVMARKALAAMIPRLDSEERAPDPPIPEWEHGDTAPPDELVNIYHNWDEVRRTMWDYVSIVRTDKRLLRASFRLRNLSREVRDFYWGYRVNSDILELRNLVTVASLVVDCAMQRKESRGIHYTLDYPGADPHLRQDTIICRP